MRKTDNHVERDSSDAFTLNVSTDCCSKGDVTRDDFATTIFSAAQRRNIVATLFHDCNTVPTLQRGFTLNIVVANSPG